MRMTRHRTKTALLLLAVVLVVGLMTACASGGNYSGRTTYYRSGYGGVGYGGYYGSPWGYDPGYVVVVDPEIDLPDGPGAELYPEMGMPDMGGMDMGGMDMGGMDMGMGMDMGGYDF